MDKKIVNITYESSIDKLTEVNSSFDAGILKIAYTNENRNRSYISKQAFERAIPTIYNCPVVCNYIRDENDFGGHDIEVVSDDDGNMKIVNSTTPCGVIPESSKCYWSVEDGHEYLCAEVLIWKRQEAYQRIKDGGITSESMEITIKDGHKDPSTGYYMIEDFEFTAFCLLGDNVTPCFEGASLQMFSTNELKEQIEQMMEDLKNTFSITTSDEEGDIHPQKIITEGGNAVLNNEFEEQVIEPETVQEEPVITPDSDDAEVVEFEAEPQPEEPVVEPSAQSEEFELMSNIMEELRAALTEEKISTEWGECPRYSFFDVDIVNKKVYCFDSNDWLLYGFDFDFNGDKVFICGNTKKRMKCTIVEFDEGEQSTPLALGMEYSDIMMKNSDLENKYATASGTIESMNAELADLREFKATTESAIANSQREEVFAKFEDLVGVEAFDSLREHCEEYDIETLEEKCFAIRGRVAKVEKFSLKNSTPKLGIDSESNDDEPYGGFFKEYLN